MSKSDQKFVEELKTGIWAVAPEHFKDAVRSMIQETQASIHISDLDMTKVGSVAVIPVKGTIFKAKALNISTMIKEALSDDEVSSILLDVDSPGGTVTGTPELASVILEARKHKKVVAFANGLMASAAFWIGASANEIVAMPSANVGSVGVFAAHLDISKMLEEMGVKVTFIASSKEKTEGNMFEPLSKDAKEFFQSRIDLHMKEFVGAISKGRGVTRAQVNKDFGNGRVFLSREALERGMIDRVATFDDTLSRMLRSSNRRDGAMRIDTVRDLEQHLRDGGISASRAKKMASHCSEMLTQEEQTEGLEELTALAQAMKTLSGNE